MSATNVNHALGEGGSRRNIKKEGRFLKSALHWNSEFSSGKGTWTLL